MKLVPKRRFKGFSGEWGERKLSEIAEINPQAMLPESFNYVDLESVVGTELIAYRTENNKSAPSRAQRLAVQGDVFYQTVRPYQKNNYLFDSSSNNFVFSTGYAQMRPNVDSHFLFSRIQEDSFVNSVLSRCTGTSYPAISSSDLADIEINVPADRSEQVKIGLFFKDLDNNIILQERHLKKLQAMKQAFLHEMFPAEGESVPKRRFDGFDENWGETELCEVADIYDGTHQTPKYKTKGVMFLSVENIETLRTVKYISKEAFERDFKVHPIKGDVLMTRIGDIGTANVVESDLPMAYYVSLALLKPKMLDPYFLKANIHSPSLQLEIYKRTLHIAFPKKINKNEIEKLLVKFPCIKEQQKIGSFFRKLDERIALQQAKIEKLKAMKQAYLHEMFV